MKRLKELQELIHLDAKTIGWYKNGKSCRTTVEHLMMVVTELSEAVEELRSSNPRVYYEVSDAGPKPCGFDVEIADAMIWLLDLAEFQNIDLETRIIEKLKYNLKRGYKHGKNF